MNLDKVDVIEVTESGMKHVADWAATQRRTGPIACPLEEGVLRWKDDSSVGEVRQQMEKSFGEVVPYAGVIIHFSCRIEREMKCRLHFIADGAPEDRPTLEWGVRLSSGEVEAYRSSLSESDLSLHAGKLQCQRYTEILCHLFQYMTDHHEEVHERVERKVIQRKPQKKGKKASRKRKVTRNTTIYSVEPVSSSDNSFTRHAVGWSVRGHWRHVNGHRVWVRPHRKGSWSEKGHIYEVDVPDTKKRALS